MKALSRSDAMWVVVRVFGFFSIAIAILAFLEFLYHGTFGVLHFFRLAAPFASFEPPSVSTVRDIDVLVPTAHALVRCLVFGWIGRYLIRDGSAVHRWSVASWKVGAPIPDADA